MIVFLFLIELSHVMEGLVICLLFEAKIHQLHLVFFLVRLPELIKLTFFRSDVSSQDFDSKKINILNINNLVE